MRKISLSVAFLLFSVVYVGAQPVFKFQSNFWINLHLYLKAEGWWQNHNRPLKIMTYKPDISEQETWKRCVNGYSELSKKKLVFGEQLINISNSLTLQNSDILPTGIGIDESLVKLLNDAAPIYRKYVWKNQSKINENWIKRIKPFIDKYAKDMLTKLSAAYQASFPSGEIIVDLSAEVGPNLAFTTKGPAASAGHIIISPEKNADSIVAFETIFHETSHIVDGQIMKHINDAAAKEKVNVPDDLWHGMIFFTAAELTKKELNLPEFTPYYIKSGIATSNDYWRKIFGALKDAWQPYLNHQTTFNNAMSQVVIKASAN